jgi:hypothetical protein
MAASPYGHVKIVLQSLRFTISQPVRLTAAFFVSRNCNRNRRASIPELTFGRKRSTVVKGSLARVSDLTSNLEGRLSGKILQGLMNGCVPITMQTSVKMLVT